MRVRRVTELLPRAADWRQARLGADLTAGLMVGLVALPLALGFGASSGLGAGAGLVTTRVRTLPPGCHVERMASHSVLYSGRGGLVW
ncbi:MULTISPECIES: hypothetical protein [unclassified Nocardioides]|uniref:hypothetical protein n=1 Tax=unclassified Nocardioides TaxID=2615069 RepID=UPI0009EFB412|nr:MULTISPECIES: hypothetical protein [unclassified Nocardioides]GAW50109.1 Sulfate transporter/antisigma-factor antagonist STAS [Nocardioides sp. PD653-B2]GAW57336.1 Sulfate transporter/antisigma-factor antagonist STAS [Nocardioides sp. PD653]